MKGSFSFAMGLLVQFCQEKRTNAQRYYNLVIYSHLLDGKMYNVAESEGCHDIEVRIASRYQAVRDTHRFCVDTV